MFAQPLGLPRGMTTQRTEERVTIFDVAREAKVSFATVSRVVNGKTTSARRPASGWSRRWREPDTSSTVRRGVWPAVGIRSSVCSCPSRHQLHREIVRGIDEALAAVSYDLMLYTTHRRKTREAAFAASLTRGMTDGLLLVLPSNPGAYLDSIRKRGFPVVLIDHGGIGDIGASVGATNRQGAYEAAEPPHRSGSSPDRLHHRHPGMGCATDRLAGYRAALTEPRSALRRGTGPRRQLPRAARLRADAGPAGHTRPANCHLRL